MSADAPSSHARTVSSAARIATALLAALALVLGVAPVASAQSGSTRIGDFTFAANVNSGGSALRPGGHVQLDLTATNTHGTGFSLASNRVLNVYGFTVPANYALRGHGGDHMGSVGNHGQGSRYWGGTTEGFGMSSVRKGSSRSGWLSFNIPSNALGGSTHQFGVRANLENDDVWFPTVDNVVRFTLPAVATTTQAVTVSPSTGRVGEPVTLSTRVTANHGTNTPTGTVRFVVDGKTVSASVNSSGVATATTTFNTTGSKSVTATYTPTSTAQWVGSSRSGTVNIQSEATQTDLSLDKVEVLAGGTVEASAAVTPAGAEGDIEFSAGGEPVRVPVDAEGKATAVLPADTAGETTVTATFIPADPQRYTSSSDSETIDAFEQTATTTEVTGAAGPVEAGEPTTLTATVTPAAAAGTATFTIGGQDYTATVSGGVATLEHTFPESGDHVVVVDFTPTNGDRYLPSSGQTTIPVDSETTATDLTLDPLTVTAGGTVQATATVTPAGAEGEVEFAAGDETVRVPVDADGTASAEFTAATAGDLTVTATFHPTNPDRYTTSTDTKSVDVTAEATQTVLTVDQDEVIPGDSVRATATVSPAGAAGAVEFSNGETTVSAPVNAEGIAVADIDATTTGPMEITATFLPADTGRYSGSTDSLSVTLLDKIATSVSVSSGSGPARVDEPTTLTARVTPAAAGTVTVTVDGQTYTADVSGGVATVAHTFTTAGDHAVEAAFAPTNGDRYESSTGQGTVTVESEATTTDLTLDPIQVTAGGTIQATAAITPAEAEGQVRFEYGDQTRTVDVENGSATAEFTAATAGTGTVTATFVPANPDRYTSSTDNKTVTVDAEATTTEVRVETGPIRVDEPTTLTATVTPAAAAGTVEITIDGQTHTATVSNGTATVEHTFTTAGEHAVSAEFIPSDSGRYSGSTGQATVAVESEATTTDLTLDPIQVTAGGTIRATAAITPAEAEGQVRFEYGDQTRTIDVENGSATAEFDAATAGTGTVTATFVPTNPDRYTGSSDSKNVEFNAEATATELSIDPAAVTVGETVTVTATITPAGAAGTVEFAYDGQTTTVQVANGTATAEFEATTTDAITATFVPADTGRYSGSSDTATFTVNAEATATDLTLDPIQVTAGGTIQATAAINPAEAQGQVRFEYGDQTRTVTVADGSATAEFTAATAGTGTIKATFLPTDPDRYTSSTDTETVQIDAEATGVSVTSGPATAGEPTTLTAQVTPAGAAGTVEFTVDGQTHTATVTNGTATVEHTFAEAGDHVVVVDFTPADSGRYTASTGRTTVTVEAGPVREPTSVELVADEAVAGEEITLTARVTPADAAGQVRFTVDGREHLVPVVDGVATLVHTPGEPGRYTVRAEFIPADTDAHAPSEETGTLVVVEEDDDDNEVTDPPASGSGSLSLTAFIGSIALGSVLHGSGSLASLGS
ncbi:beta strand repeat-containing protein [Dietzia kunjamensis]|uniref:beta strand repeat-containing protein n=1 Tax=Dietzia kunjamensis TaxID=322509 RepID=UPI0039BC4201